MDTDTQLREEQRTEEISSQFEPLQRLIYFTAGATTTLTIFASVVLNNAAIAVTGVSTSVLTLYSLASIREQATRTAATLLLNNDANWTRQLVDQHGRLVQWAAQEVTPLAEERNRLAAERIELSQRLAKADFDLSSRQAQIKSLKAQVDQLLEDKRTIEKTLSEDLTKAKTALAKALTALDEKRHDLETHLNSIEGQIIDIWNPLFQGLINICDRYDPNRPVADLDYAGKPNLSLTDEERRRWRHYRDSLMSYDRDLRKQVKSMSDLCDTHDEAYGFFLNLLEKLTTDYCKLWANIKDIEVGTLHENEKRTLASQIENVRKEWETDASGWLERSSTVEEGLTEIERHFLNEIGSLQQRLIAYEQQIEELEAPRKFRGSTSVDVAGNRLIDYFAQNDIILDAIESVKIPGGFRLRFSVARNGDATRMAESEFDKHCEHLALWGLSSRPLDFTLDSGNFLLSVDLSAVADNKQRMKAVSSIKQPGGTVKIETIDTEVAEKFQSLECYTADEFEEVVREKFVPRVRVVAGSTGGKSPLLELIACAIARINGGELWLINPIPGSPKDWFTVPGVVPTGINGIEESIKWLEIAHGEFTTRRNDLPRTATQPFITVAVDEVNAIAREYIDLGKVMKDFYQLSDHTRMGFCTAGQGGNVSGMSGGSQSRNKTGNANKLMEEDFQNATQVFTAAAAKHWIEKNLKGSQKDSYINRLSTLNKLCAELNDEEGKSPHPKNPESKTVSPDAYRIALVVSPREVDPFFIQIPPYSSYMGRMEGVSFPAGAKITAPQENQMKLGLIGNGKPESFTCGNCGHHKLRRKGTYRNGQPRYVCEACGRVPSLQESLEDTIPGRSGQPD